MTATCDYVTTALGMGLLAWPKAEPTTQLLHYLLGDCI